MGYAAYFQDDLHLNDRLTLNLGLRWEYELGLTDPQNRLSQRLDLTQAIPEMQTTPPAIPSQAQDLMSAKGYSYSFNGAWIFATASSPHAWHSTPWNFLPRAGVNYRMGDDAVVRFAYARYLIPPPTCGTRWVISSTSIRIRADHDDARAGERSAAANAGLRFPTNNPVIEPYGQAYGGTRASAARSAWTRTELRLDERPVQRVVSEAVALGHHRRAQLLRQPGLARLDNINLNLMDPVFKYKDKTLINTQVTNPFYNYLTVDKFPVSPRSNKTVALSALLVPYLQYGTITQTNTNGKLERTHTFEVRAQRPFTHGLSFVVGYAWNRDCVQEMLDDVAQYKVLTTNGKDGWEWRPTDTPVHRLTAALSWELPIGRDPVLLSGCRWPLICSSAGGSTR